MTLPAAPTFGAIGYYYRDFRQVSDAEVIDILKRHPVRDSPKVRQPAT